MRAGQRAAGMTAYPAQKGTFTFAFGQVRSFEAAGGRIQTGHSPLLMPRNSLVSSAVPGGADGKRGRSVKAHRGLLGFNFLLISTAIWAAPYKRLQPSASGRVPRSRNVVAQFGIGEALDNDPRNGLGRHGRTAA
jgi:hypothetical protein